MKKTLIILAVSAAAVGVYMNMKRKAAKVVKRPDGSFAPETKRAVSNDPMVRSFEVNQRNIFAGGDYRNTPLPEAVDQSFVQS